MPHNSPVEQEAGMDHKQTISELAELMQQYRLSEARLQSGDLTIAFRRRASRPAPSSGPSHDGEPLFDGHSDDFQPSPAAAPTAPKGTPVSSPMSGIYYSGSSPSAPAFV